jgi:hypothetical protein
MNKGLKMATGDYCLFLNSGDYLISTSTLEELCGNINEKIDVLYGDLEFDYISCRRREVHPVNYSIYNFVYTSMPHQASLIRTNLLLELNGYDESFKIISDWIFFLRALIEKKAVFKKINIIVAVFDLNGISMTTKNHNEKIIAIKKYFPYLESDFNYIRELRYYKLSRSHQLLKKTIYFIKGFLKKKEQ